MEVKYLKVCFMILSMVIFLQFIVGHENEEYGRNYNDYFKTLDSIGIENTLQIIKTLYEQNNLTSDECHFLLHTLGGYASNKFGIKRSIEDSSNLMDVCRSGFIHGIFLSADLEQINNGDICTGKSLKSYALKLQCLHGLGHGQAVFFDYNLSKALNICESLSKEKYRSACATGVFMEEFSPRAHFSKNATEETSSICEENNFKPECYWYIGIRITKDNKSLADGIKDCDKIESNYQVDCQRGFGVLSARRTNYNQEEILLICKGSKECLSGSASEFGLSKELIKGLAFCKKSPRGDKLICFSELINSYSKHL